MLKGAQKRMVMLRTADSSIFEAAYFILRDDAAPPTQDTQPTMLEEANRILSQSFAPHGAVKSPKQGCLRKLWRWLPAFVLGLLCGAGLCTVLTIFIL